MKNMRKSCLATVIAALAATMLCFACPHTPGPNGPPAKDPYATARAVIQGAQIAVAGADGVFEIILAFTDPAKVPELRKTYLKIRGSVLDGLKVALDAVAVAESQKDGFDIAKLLAPAEAAYQDLLKFIAGLKSMPASGPAKALPLTPELPPTLLPATGR